MNLIQRRQIDGSVSDNLPSSDENCIARFFEAQDSQGNEELQHDVNTKLVRQHKLDLLKSSHEARNVEPFPPSEYVFISNGGDETPDYSVETVAKARDFANICLKPWLKERKELQTLGDVFRQRERRRPSYEYPIAKDSESMQEVMAESQWVPFALGMEQSRRRFKASLDKPKCNPLRMIINGDGGSGKSWLIRHLGKDVH
ncbi:hypothetical protein GQ600_26855 [Phytophthora cactorum]|nr:hypothetical protein GQ600_26855 [Phytophthora cactorum]